MSVDALDYEMAKAGRNLLFSSVDMKKVYPALNEIAHHVPDDTPQTK